MSHPTDLLDAVRTRLDRLGFELVDFRRVGTLDRPILQIRVDRPGAEPGRGITTEDLTGVSRALERWLEEEHHVGPRYVLEVSSPGIERPVRFPEHWRRYVGSEVRLKARGLKGHPRARIKAVPDDAHVTLRFPDGHEATLALEVIREATLVVDWSTYGKRQGA
ncbi:MAG: ribosome maturation factor RimP [Gemmatimonadota bacterium]